MTLNRTLPPRTPAMPRIEPDLLTRPATPTIVLTLVIPTFILSLPATLAAQDQDPFPPDLSTFSIVACDLKEGFWGVGIQSRVVGAGSIVPAAAAGVGAIASQAAANVGYKAEGLALLEDGMTAEEVKAHFLATDPGESRRQFSIIDGECRIATHTGAQTSPWAGHRVGATYSVQGNILAGEEVVNAMAEAYEAAERAGWPFGERILASLKAGQDAGGDTRGRQGAGLLIVREGAGYGGGDDRYADLRVEDHVEPILELERVYDIWMSLFHPVDHFAPRGRKVVAAPSGPHICELRRMLTRLGHDSFSPRPGGCAFDDEAIAALRRFQRARGLPETPVVNEAVSRALREAYLAEGAPEG